MGTNHSKLINEPMRLAQNILLWCTCVCEIILAGILQKLVHQVGYIRSYDLKSIVHITVHITNKPRHVFAHVDE